MATLLILNAAMAEEVVQESFIALHDAWQSLDCGYERSLAYLRQNIVNRSRSVLTYRSVAGRLITPADESALRGGEGDTPTFSGRSTIIDAICSLPARQREALVLRYYSDLSEAAIAEVMGISRGAVKCHTARAMSSLRAVLLRHNPIGQPSPDSSEHEPAAESLSEERAAWISFYETHYQRVVRFVMLHDGTSLAAAQDAAHEAFIESWAMVVTNPVRWVAITDQATWIRTMAVQKSRRPAGSRIRPQRHANVEIPDLPSPKPCVVTVQTRAILQALRRLDAESRAVMAFYLDYFTTADIASALGITEQRVRDMKEKARVAVKQALAAIPEGGEDTGRWPATRRSAWYSDAPNRHRGNRRPRRPAYQPFHSRRRTTISGIAAVVTAVASIIGFFVSHPVGVTELPMSLSQPYVAAHSATELTVVSAVIFESDSTVFADPIAAANTLTPVAQWLTVNSAGQVQLVGTTADVGSMANQISLSRARAESVRAKLIALGAPPGQITITGVGSNFSQFVQDRSANGTLLATQAALNRSVRIMITETAKKEILHLRDRIGHMLFSLHRHRELAECDGLAA